MIREFILRHFHRKVLALQSVSNYFPRQSRFRQNADGLLVRMTSISASVCTFREGFVPGRAFGILRRNHEVRWETCKGCQARYMGKYKPASIRSLALALLIPEQGVSPLEKISHMRIPYDQTSQREVYLPKFKASGAVHLIGICFIPSETEKANSSYTLRMIIKP